MDQYAVRYATDDDDEGVNVGPFEFAHEAQAYLASHPVASSVEPALSDSGNEDDEWAGYVITLRDPN